MTDTTDYERALLGAILGGAHRVLPDLARQLTPEDFQQPAHGMVWDAALRVFNSGGAPDPLTVRTALGEWANRLPEGPAYLATLIGDGGPSVQHYADQIKAGSVRRRLRDVAARVDQLSQDDGDPDEVINEAAAMLEALREDRPQTSAVTIGQVLPSVIDIAEHGRAQGLPTPWPDLNRLLRGLHGGRLYVVGARPGVGKSLLGQALATHWTTRHNAAAYVASLEMGADEFVQRALASQARVDLGKLDTGGLDDRDWSKVSEAVPKLNGGAPLLINDDASQTLADIRAGAQDAARRHNLGLIVVDYLQLVRPADRKLPREQQVAELSRGFKRLARELRVPVVALAQVNRGPTSRQDSRPSMNDLRESGSLEADADAVLLLHTDPELPHIVEVDVPKNRSGPKGHAELLIAGHYARLDSMAANA